jgi:phospholipid/cholesterol/gamma-HCH transport system permease protein
VSRVTLNTTSNGAVIAVTVSDAWRIREGLESIREFETLLQTSQRAESVQFAERGLGDWDSSLIAFIIGVIERCEAQQIPVDTSALPEGVRGLIDIALAVPERSGAARTVTKTPFLEGLGKNAMAAYAAGGEMVVFIGESLIAVGNWFRGRAQYRRSDMLLTFQESGAAALGIVTLISLLIGLIIAFVGAVSLQQFGASIFVADLVGLAITRELAPVMTAIVMAGRTGAAFAAQLGTMRVNEEIDSLSTLGINPMEFLVLPRMVALAAMMPLLVIYSDLIGLFGGWLVGVGMLDLTSTAYIGRTQEALDLTDLSIGLVKGVVFGLLVAISGCLRGMQCGTSSAAVGLAATSAVVTGIVAIVSTDAVFAVVTNILGI